MLTRRQLLRMGIVGGAAALVPWERALVAIAQPATAQFAVPLPIPPVLVPTSTDGDTDYYDIEMRPADVEILPGQTTRVWSYDGMFPGPTIAARSNRRTVVTQVNNLEVDASVHNHGAHTTADSDGHPVDIIEPGSQKVYTYPNDQIASTLWYHDHVMHQTSRNIYMGLAAAYLIGDDVEDALDLPRGEHDIPCILMDRTFNEDGSLAFGDSHNTVIGNTILVNGRPWPYLEVGTRKYRVRFINASNSREYELALDNGEDLVQIGSDGGLLSAPFRSPSIRITPAERIEVVVDFSAVPVGTSIVLRNLAGSSFSGTDTVMRFDVVRDEEDSSSLPDTLRAIAPIGEATVVRDINLSFDSEQGLWVINGLPFDEDRIDVRPQLDVPEIWEVSNSAGAPHPFHIHLSFFQVLDRDGVPPEPGEAGWKDTVNVRPGETVRLKIVFTEYTGVFVYHCHNLAHEDHDMMAQMEVVATAPVRTLERVGGEDRFATAAMVSAATFSSGVPVAYVATGDDFPDALAGGAVAGREGGPVLLVGRGRLPEATAAELERCQPERIVVLGGTAAIVDRVVEELRAFAPVERIGGEDRFATAAMLSAATFPPGVPVAYVATGDDFPDALAGGAAAGREGGPVLLVGHGRLPEATAAELERCQPERIVVLGGTGAVTDRVVEQLEGYAPVTRVGGADRHATATRLSSETVPAASTVFVATGDDFPDALTASAAAIVEDAPVLLVQRTTVPGVVGDELARLLPARVVLLGGGAAVSDEVEEALRTLLES